jgi:hypothetical protein
MDGQVNAAASDGPLILMPAFSVGWKTWVYAGSGRANATKRPPFIEHSLGKKSGRRNCDQLMNARV